MGVGNMEKNELPSVFRLKMGITGEAAESRPRPRVPRIRVEPTPKAKKGKMGLGGKIVLGTLATAAAVEGVGAVVQEQINDQPVSAHTIAEDVQWPLNLAHYGLEAIRGDNTAPVTDIETPPGDFKEKFPIALTPDKFETVTSEQEQILWQNTEALDLKNHTFTTGFPFDVDRNPDLMMDQEFNAVLPAWVDGNKLKREGVKNVTYFSGLGKGEHFRLYYDSRKWEASVILMYPAGITQGKGLDGSLFTPAYTLYVATLRNKETGEITGKSIAGLYAEPLIQTNPYPENHSLTYEDGAPIKSGEAIMKLTTDLRNEHEERKKVRGQKGQFVVTTSYKQRNPRAPIPLTETYLPAPSGRIAVFQTP